MGPKTKRQHQTNTQRGGYTKATLTLLHLLLFFAQYSYRLTPARCIQTHFRSRASALTQRAQNRHRGRTTGIKTGNGGAQRPGGGGGGGGRDAATQAEAVAPVGAGPRKVTERAISVFKKI